MRYDVTRAFDRLLNRKVSIYRRAITLFELQTAVLACKGKAPKPNARDSKFTITCDPKLVRSARVLATLKLLQHAAAEQDGSDNLFKLVSLVANQETADLLNDLIFGKSGLERVRYAIRPKEFSGQIKRLTAGAHCVNCLADFSLKFPSANKATRKRGGITTALQVVYLDQDSDQPVYDLELKEDSARNYARDLGPIIALSWLSARHGNFLLPPIVHKTSFAPKLIKSAKRVGDLEDIVAAYPFVASRLNHRGYKCLPLEVKKSIELAETDVGDMPKQLIDLI